MCHKVLTQQNWVIPSLHILKKDLAFSGSHKITSESLEYMSDKSPFMAEVFGYTR
jgi:hypothetical protein